MAPLTTTNYAQVKDDVLEELRLDSTVDGTAVGARVSDEIKDTRNQRYNADLAVENLIDVKIEDEREEARQGLGKEYFQSERWFCSLRRTIELPESEDLDGIKAESENGIPMIHFKKKSGLKTLVH